MMPGQETDSLTIVKLEPLMPEVYFGKLINKQTTCQQLSQMTATGVEQAANASYAQTEMYFVQHSDYLMPRVHEMRTDLAQYYHSTKPSTRLTYITSQDEKVNFQINGTDVTL